MTLEKILLQSLANWRKIYWLFPQYICHLIAILFIKLTILHQSGNCGGIRSRILFNYISVINYFISKVSIKYFRKIRQITAHLDYNSQKKMKYYILDYCKKIFIPIFANWRKLLFIILSQSFANWRKLLFIIPQ